MIAVYKVKFKYETESHVSMEVEYEAVSIPDIASRCRELWDALYLMEYAPIDSSTTASEDDQPS